MLAGGYAEVVRLGPAQFDLTPLKVEDEAMVLGDLRLCHDAAWTEAVVPPPPPTAVETIVAIALVGLQIAAAFSGNSAGYSGSVYDPWNKAPQLDPALYTASAARCLESRGYEVDVVRGE